MGKYESVGSLLNLAETNNIDIACIQETHNDIVTAKQYKITQYSMVGA